MAHNVLTDAERQESWRLLFDGKTLNGWQATGKPEGWAVSDEAILCTVQKGRYLYTVEQFEDYELALEFKIAPKTNSGIFVRWSDLTDPVHTGIEIQILDSYGAEQLGTHTCGAIYDMVPPSDPAFRPAGEWNQVLVTCDGPLVSVTLNGKRIAEMDAERWKEAGRNPDGSENKFKYAWATMPRRGHIGLQDHGGKVWFRNIKLKPLR